MIFTSPRSIVVLFPGNASHVYTLNWYLITSFMLEKFASYPPRIDAEERDEQPRLHVFSPLGIDIW